MPRKQLGSVGALGAALLALVSSLGGCGRSHEGPGVQSSGSPKPYSVVDPRSAQVDVIAARVVQAEGPGIAIAVVEKGRVVVAKGYGLADLARHTKITSATNFDLASVSKQLTAMVILQLEQRGLLRIDDDVRGVLPELTCGNQGRPIRIADLLHMTSGLAEYTDALDDFEDPSTITDDDIVRWAGKQPLRFPTGTRFEYTNTNFVALARIAERVTGRSFAELLRAQILEPLAMNGTVVFDRRDVAVPLRAMGYAEAKGMTQGFLAARDDVPCTGDGNVFSSVDDLVRWDLALREAWRGSAGPLIPHEALARAFASGGLDSGASTGYGFAWFVGERRGHRLVDHSGAWAGTAAYIARYLDDDVTVILLSNDEDLDLGVADEIADVFLPRR